MHEIECIILHNIKGAIRLVKLCTYIVHTSVFELAPARRCSIFSFIFWEKLFGLLKDAWWKWLIDRLAEDVNVSLEDDDNASEAEK